MKPLFHPETEHYLTALKAELPHAILLKGAKGSGTATAARHLADEQVSTVLIPLSVKGEVDVETGTISVEMIRDLYNETRTKNRKRRIVLIDGADRMSRGAQSAFLKLLEEPNQGTHFILLSHTPEKLLPTIHSRVQSLTIRPITQQQTEALIASLSITDPHMQRQLDYLARGLPAEIVRLSRDADYFQSRAEAMSATRTLLTGNTYEKITLIQAYYKDKAKSLGLLESALTVTERSLTARPQQALIRQLDQILKVKESIEANANIRLQLLSFVLQ